MFIYSMRASTLKFFGAIFLSLALFLTLLSLTSPAGAEGEDTEVVNYSGIRSEEERIAFLESFGWQVSPTDREVKEFLLPKEFDRVLSGYNEIQKEQGLDLSRYRNKKVRCYVYKVENYEGAANTVYATLLMYNNRVVAADISMAGEGGFVRGLSK